MSDQQQPKTLKEVLERIKSEYRVSKELVVPKGTLKTYDDGSVSLNGGPRLFFSRSSDTASDKEEGGHGEGTKAAGADTGSAS